VVSDAGIFQVTQALLNLVADEAIRPNCRRRHCREVYAFPGSELRATQPMFCAA